MSEASITLNTGHDWSRADAMTEADIHAAALANPDAQPLTPERLAGMTQPARLKIIRRALGLTREEFAATLRETAAIIDAADHLKVSEPDRPRVLDLLEHPPAPNAKLRAAAAA